MGKIKLSLDTALISFLYLWGGMENPAERKAKETIKDTTSIKIKNDLKRINKDFRDSYIRVRKEALSICE